MADLAYQTADFAYQGQGEFAYQDEPGLAPVDVGGGGRIKPLRLPRLVKGETEEQKLERRIREGTIAPPVSNTPIEIKTGDKPEMLREQARIATALKAVRAERDTLRTQIDELQKMQTKKASKALWAKRQEEQYASLKEQFLLQESEAIEVALVAIAVFFG